MRCKIFTYMYNDAAQTEEVNKWLEAVGDIKIVHSNQSSASVSSSIDPRDGEYVETVLTIFYEKAVQK